MEIKQNTRKYCENILILLLSAPCVPVSFKRGQLGGRHRKEALGTPGCPGCIRSYLEARLPTLPITDLCPRTSQEEPYPPQPAVGEFPLALPPPQPRPWLTWKGLKAAGEGRKGLSLSDTLCFQLPRPIWLGSVWSSETGLV